MERVKAIFTGLFTQLGKLWKVLLFLYGSILLFFVVLNVISRSSDHITLSYFTRDVSAIGDLPFYAGLVSQLGGLLWSAALTICIFTFILLKRLGPDTERSRRFLLQAVILTGTLLLDDIFLFHEDIGPDYLHLSERVIVLSYLILTVLFLFINFREILSSEYLLLGLALAMFGLSIFLDAADLDDYDRYGLFFSEQFQIFLEDGFKFVGIATWLAYFLRYSVQRIKMLIR
jgi:hypothetical protein